MKNNIFWCFLGFSIGTVWAFVGWIVLATVSMFSVPDVNDSSFDQMKQCRLESATITYRKKEKATGAHFVIINDTEGLVFVKE